MWSLEAFIGLLIAVVVLVRVSRVLELPPAILLLLGGLALSYIPPFGNLELSPEMVFTIFLPPLLFYAAFFTSWRDFKQNARPIGLLAIGLVVATTEIVELFENAVIHYFTLAAAFALGAIVSPTDAIAATSITERIGVPRRIVTVLEGESLVNDATGIVAYRVAVAAVVTNVFSFLEAGQSFLVSSAGGILVGLAAGWLYVFLLKRFDDAPVENTITVIAPFTAYIVAENLLHVSGVLAVVTAGLYFARRAPRIISSDTRLQGESFWQMLDFLFNGTLFLLLGLQLRRIVAGLGDTSLTEAIFYAFVVSAITILTRILWVYPATYLPRMLSKSLRQRDPYPSWKPIFIVAWTGMRGAISLAAALALPYTTAAGAEFPQRNLIIFIAFVVILATLVLQGLSLPPIIKWLGVRGDNSTAREEAKVRISVTQAALDKIKTLEESENAPPNVLRRIKSDYRNRLTATEAALAEGEDACRVFYATDRSLRLEIVRAEREAWFDLRTKGEFHDHALRHVEHDIDLTEQQLKDHDHGLNGGEHSR